jgi:putative endonuclease
MADHIDTGKLGEDLAIEHLANKGFSILERNWHFRKLELDIIAMDGEYLVIVEVKTRTSSYFENPKDAITLKKQKFLFDAAEAYILETKDDHEIRFDIVEVLLENDNTLITHIEDAFAPGW